MSPRRLLVWVAGLSIVLGCEAKPQPQEQALKARVEPVMQISLVEDGLYDVRCELRSQDTGGKQVSLGPRMVIPANQTGQVSMCSNGFIRFMFDVKVQPTDNPQKVRVTYLLLIATAQGIRPWQGRAVEWTLGEARVLADEPPQPASAPAENK